MMSAHRRGGCLRTPRKAPNSPRGAVGVLSSRIRALLAAAPLFAVGCNFTELGKPDQAGTESENSGGEAASSESDTGGSGDPVSTCDPLYQDCGPGEGCYLVGQAFDCSPAGDNPGDFGEACGPGVPCAPGLECSGQEVVAGCSEGFGCCTYFCLPDGDECPGSLECVPLFETPPPGSGGPVGMCI